MRKRTIWIPPLLAILGWALAVFLLVQDPIRASSPPRALSASESPPASGGPTVQTDRPAAESIAPAQPTGSIPADVAAGQTIRGPGAVSGALLLAHLYAVETDVFQPIDRAIMVHVLDKRRDALSELEGRPIGLVEAADRYSRGILRTAPRARRGRLQWILALDGGDTRPAHFPSSRSWPVYHRGFAIVLSEATAHLAGHRPPDPCRGLAGIWGGRGRLATTTDAPSGSMRRIVCNVDQILHTYSTARTRRAVLYRAEPPVEVRVEDHDRSRLGEARPAAGELVDYETGNGEDEPDGTET